MAAASAMPAAAMAAASAVAPAASSAAAAVALARGARGGFAYGEFSSEKVLAVEAFDGRPGLLRVVHGHEGEAARAAGFPVGDDFQLIDGAKLLERFRQISFGCVEGKVSYIDFH